MTLRTYRGTVKPVVVTKVKKSTAKERIHTLIAAIVGSVAGFPEQLFWGDCGLGLCSEAQGEAWLVF